MFQKHFLFKVGSMSVSPFSFRQYLSRGDKEIYVEILEYIEILKLK